MTLRDKFLQLLEADLNPYKEVSTIWSLRKGSMGSFNPERNETRRRKATGAPRVFTSGTLTHEQPPETPINPMTRFRRRIKGNNNEL